MIDLHCHISGSLEANDVYDLIIENDISIDKNREDFINWYICSPNGKVRHQEAMEKFILLNQLTPIKGIKEIIGEKVAQTFLNHGVTYVEWRIDPFSATENETAEEGLEKINEYYKGMKKTKLESKFILGIGRHRCKNIPYIREQMKKLLSIAEFPVVGLDAVNAEKISIKELEPILSLAHDFNIGLVPHVGELTSSTIEENFQTIEDALAMGADRLGHAIVAYMDLGQKHKERQDEVLNKIKKSGVPIEVCPTSNLSCHLGLLNYSQHPIKRLIEWNIPFVICTDDYGIFGKTLKEEIDGLGISINNEKYKLNHK